MNVEISPIQLAHYEVAVRCEMLGNLVSGLYQLEDRNEMTENLLASARCMALLEPTLDELDQLRALPDSSNRIMDNIHQCLDQLIDNTGELPLDRVSRTEAYIYTLKGVIDRHSDVDPLAKAWRRLASKLVFFEQFLEPPKDDTTDWTTDPRVLGAIDAVGATLGVVLVAQIDVLPLEREWWDLGFPGWKYIEAGLIHLRGRVLGSDGEDKTSMIPSNARSHSPQPKDIRVDLESLVIIIDGVSYKEDEEEVVYFVQALLDANGSWTSVEEAAKRSDILEFAILEGARPSRIMKKMRAPIHELIHTGPRGCRLKATDEE